ncbi:MAG: DNA primase [Parcubacteria group bacterium Licking1014_1]|nr:MAG: DNA primase [Parcubacteria group bacterium Licking1014_1]
MQDSQIEEIKNKLDILDVIGSYIKLTKTGINYRGVCPFHSEKKPSFFVSPVRQMWKCFGCGAGHSIFDFVMKIEGVEFGDALKILAQKAGIELKKENPKLRTERQRLYEICELACLFFEKQLYSGNVGKEAKEYLLKRGIKEENIKKWRLGYSPDTWQGLSDFLVGKGYAREEVVKAGLAVEKEGRNAADSYDRFRGRIIFPVFDLNSQVVGFGARVFKAENEKETAKYINTPQTLLYNKSNILYGLNNAKLAIRKNNQCVLTEGYTDVIMCHQAGFDNTVASSGTALTSGHLDALKRYSENLLLAFDMDIAGDSATKRGIDSAQERGFNIKIIETYSKDADPADIISKNPQEWEKCLGAARSIMDYYFDSAFANFDKSAPEGKKEISRIILPVIKRIPNKIEQSHWLQKLSQKLGIREEVIIEELKKAKGASISKISQNTEGKTCLPADRKKLIEEKIISLVLKDPENLNLIEELHNSFFSERTKKLIENLKNPLSASNDEELNNFLAVLSLRAEVDFEEDGQKEIQLCLLQLKNMSVREKLGEISDNIRKAEEARDFQRVNILMEEFNKIIREL